MSFVFIENRGRTIRHSGCLPRGTFAMMGVVAWGLAHSSALADPRGSAFTACGDLIQTTGFPPCLVFVPDTGEKIMLTDNGTFAAGDRVYVAGDFDPNTAFICDFELVPRLINTLIEPCFAACGTVLPDDGVCERISTDAGHAYALMTPTGLPAGTEIFVNGRISPVPASCAAGPTQLIENSEIGLCGGGFGRLLSRFGCTIFVDRSGAAFELQNDGAFDVGDFVVVEGFLDSEVTGPCGFPRIRQNTIRPAFGGPGTVVMDDSCGLVFRADLGNLGIQYRVNGIEAYSPGERVFVTGIPDPACVGIPECPVACMTESSIEPLYAQCGGLTSGAGNCALFDTLDGGPQRLVENDGNLAPGSYVFVAGSARSDSVICDSAEYETIVDNMILPCFQGCGELQLGFECAPLFFADSGGIFWLENTNGFHIGDRVLVQGGVGGICNAFCPFPCIQANAISYCPGAGDVNLDGFPDPQDIPYFVAVILGDDTTIERVRQADVNGSGTVDGADIPLFTLYVMGI